MRLFLLPELLPYLTKRGKSVRKKVIQMQVRITPYNVT